MSLSSLIRTERDRLVREWEDFAAAQLPAARGLSREELSDSAARLLEAIADDMETGQSAEDQAEKSQGRRPGNAPDLVRIGQEHAATRLSQGFTVDQMVAEYRALRASVIRHWDAEARSGESDARDIVRFNESVDECLTESLAWYGTRLNSARHLFLSVLGHDLRNPLGAIMMSADVLTRDQQLDKPSMEAAVRILSSAARIQRMIEDLLDFTTTGLGTRLPLHRTSQPLRGAFQQTIDELIAFHPKADIRFQCQGELQGEWDADRLSQVMSNLVGNAIEHGEPDKPVTVVAEEQGDEVVLRVHNDGPLIPRAMQEKIFDPLMRGAQEAGRQEQHGSLGLGLYICKQIAEAHGGRIEVSSAADTGTTFTVTLPRTQPQAAAH